MTLVERAYSDKGSNLWLITCACDIIALAMAYALMVLIKWLLGMPLHVRPWTVGLGFITIVIIVVIYLISGLYSSRRFRPFSFEVERIVLSNALAVVVVSTVLFVAHDVIASRSVLLLFFGLSSVAVIIERWIWRKVIAMYRRRGVGMHNLLMVGSGETAEKFFAETVLSGHSSDYGFEYCGYVAYRENPKISGYLGGTERYHDILKSGAVTEVIFASDRLKFDAIGRMIATASRCGVRVSVIPSFNDFYPKRMTDERVGDQRMITLQLSPNSNPAWSITKRFFDILGAVVGLIIGSPFMLVAAIMIKTASPEGPVIFKQERCGRNGKPFTMYKFRTMIPDAESKLDELRDRNEMDGPVFKISEDPRIIKRGSFLRKTSIDEIPQFVNVLQGFMSLVGPRPPLPSEVRGYDDWEWVRLAVKPGMTCYWQVSGRSDVDFDEWMQLDFKYVLEQSFATDAKILAKTVAVVFKGTGAR